ncbi:hypothetical protein [Pseudoxanthomonas sp. z9]|uniref:hypothetical protein n=1 Tax=Pseudoxanthomonas sp. z9 TaxID=2584942 RepID=UPI00114211B4|nr:hypothetical protein [Pseudoxanthomonas sp. z9]
MACDWIGFCSLKEEAQAAWAQAVLSVFAIGVAIYLPHRDRKAELRRRLDVYCTLLGTLSTQAKMDAEHLERAIQIGGDATRPLDGWQKMVDAIASCPLHDVPDHRLVLLLSDAGIMAGMEGEAWNRGRGADVIPAERRRALRDLKIAANTLREIHEDAVAIRNELGSSTWIGAARYRAFRLKRWLAAKREKEGTTGA